MLYKFGTYNQLFQHSFSRYQSPTDTIKLNTYQQINLIRKADTIIKFNERVLILKTYFCWMLFEPTIPKYINFISKL